MEQDIRRSTQLAPSIYVSSLPEKSLKSFLVSYPCLPAPARPNTNLRFSLVNSSKPRLSDSPSTLNALAWFTLISRYPSPLGLYLYNILTYGALVGYDVRFAEDDQYAFLRLKQSKTDIKHTGVQIILSATGMPTCPVTALRRLFNHVKQPASAPLFMLSNGAFSRVSVISILKSRLTRAGLSETGFSGHSFRKGAAQHAFDQGMLDSQIQKLGRWTSNSFQLYFETSLEALFNLNLRFQTACSLAIPRGVGKPRKTHAPAFT